MIAQLDPDYIRTSLAKTLVRLISYTFYEGRPLTTRGRWINPLVSLHLEIAKRLPAIKPVRQPVFILGTGRSGTTLLGMLLSMHKDVAYLNEPKAIWHKIIPIEDIIGNYKNKETLYRLDESNYTERMGKAANRIFSEYLSLTFSKRVVDKYPELVYRVPFVLKLFPDARFIQIVRDGRDTIQSIEKWSGDHRKVINGETHDWWGRNRQKWQLMVSQIIMTDPYYAEARETIAKLENEQDMAAVEWIVAMREGVKQKSLYSESVHILKYEDLVAEPEAVLSDLLGFCRLEKDKRFMEYAKKRVRLAKANTVPEVSEPIRPLFEETLAVLGYN